MSRSQRIVAVLYCLLVVYCCTWVPWVFMMPHAEAQASKMQQGYDWVWSVGCEPATAASGKVDLSAGIEEAKPGDSAPKFEVVDAPPPSPCHGFKVGGLDMTAIGLRLLAATALSGAAFLLAGKWKGSHD
jgi:hypothetical protein